MQAFCGLHPQARADAHQQPLQGFKPVHPHQQQCPCLPTSLQAKHAAHFCPFETFAAFFHTFHQANYCVCRHSIESLHRPELPSNTRPFREANYPQPMHGNPPAPDMLLYPPLEHDNRRASSSNFGYSGRHSLSAHGQRPLGQGNEVQRPDYMQRWAHMTNQVSRRN